MPTQFPAQIDGGYSGGWPDSPITAVETAIGTTNSTDPNSITYQLRVLQEPTAQDFDLNGGTP